MITLLLVSQAFALDTESLRSTSTYNLFRDPYDYLLMPGVMAAEDERAVITLLNAYGGAGRYAAGYYGELGPGVLGAAVDFGSAGSSAREQETEKIADVQTKSVLESQGSSSAWTALLSYGMPLSDSLALGAAFYVSQASQSVSFDPATGSLGGSITNIDVSDGDDTEASGLASYTGRSLAALVGGALYNDAGYLSLDVGIGSSLDSAEVDAHYEYVDTTIDYSGYVPGTSFTDNRKGMGPLAKLEIVRAVGDSTDLRITADLSMASGEPATPKSTIVTEAPDYKNTEEDQYKNASWRTSTYGVLAALHFEGEDLSVRPGVRIRANGYGEEYTPYSKTTTVSGDTETETESEYDTSLDYSALSLGLPLAVEVPLGQEDRWTLRLAGDWTWSRAKLETTTKVEDEDAEYSDVVITNSVSTSSSADASLGLRFAPVDALRMDVAAYGGTTFGSAGNDAINIGSVWVSATLVLP